MNHVFNKVLLFAFGVAQLCFPSFLSAQSDTSGDPVLLSVAGENVTRSAFERVYKKNSTKDAAMDKKSIQEYLELFINYKLKVKEAEKMGLDSSESFVGELKGYRKQLAQPYLTDREVTEKLVREAYDRVRTEVRASHILIRVAPDALPKDTAAAYRRIMKIRELIMKGADFSKIARDSSDDKSAQTNGGDLGYFSALSLVYPFETAAYNTKPGTLSMPVRSQFGYHLIKVTDARPSNGEVQVAHIMLRIPKEAKPEDAEKIKTKIDEIYAKLKAGASFDELVQQHSEDPGSNKKGGVLPWTVCVRNGFDRRLEPEFEEAAFMLKKDGDISQPVKTSYGWHIIKRVSKKELPKFEDLQAELKSRIAKDERSEMSKTSLLNRIKKEYNFKEVPKAKEAFYKLIDSTLVQGGWEMDKAKTLQGNLFSLLDKNYTQQDFAQYIVYHQMHRTNVTPRAVLDDLYNNFVAETCLNFEESRLEQKYPDFKALVEEYRDGILLFELTDKKVWSKAVKDTLGLREYYSKVKNNYMWPERVDAAIYFCANEEVAKQVRKLMKKQTPKEKILAEVNKTSQLNLKITEGRYMRGDEAHVDSVKWEKSISPNMKSGSSIVFVEIKSFIPPTPKSLEEAKGLVTADYQAYLEKQWIEELRNKYPVTIRQEVLSTFIK